MPLACVSARPARKAVALRRFVSGLHRHFFSKTSSLGQRVSYPPLQNAGMKHYSTRARRGTLLPVPYSTRPDRLERGIRLLRALRESLAAAPVNYARPQQCEFEFALSNVR